MRFEYPMMVDVTFMVIWNVIPWNSRSVLVFWNNLLLLSEQKSFTLHHNPEDSNLLYAFDTTMYILFHHIFFSWELIVLYTVFTRMQDDSNLRWFLQKKKKKSAKGKHIYSNLRWTLPPPLKKMSAKKNILLVSSYT